MKLTTLPTNFIETVLFMGNRLPTPIAETFGAMMLARAIEGANNLGIFNYLGRGPASLDTLCAALSLNPVIVGALLEALEACGYVQKKGGQFHNSAITQRFLVESSEAYVGNFIRYNAEQRIIWLALETMARAHDTPLGLQQALKQMAQELTARFPQDAPDSYNVHHVLKDEAVWRNYMLGLRDLARISLPELQLVLRLPRRPESLLDLGGGHGAYSIWMCQRYPGLRATVLDLEGAARVGQEQVAEAGLSQRIAYQVGDLMEADLGEARHDVVFAFNLIHHLKPEENQRLLGRIARALRPGGTLVIWDEFRDEALKKSEIARLVGVMFLLASGGDTYSFDQVGSWMRASGLKPGRRHIMLSAPGTAMMWARKVLL